MRWRLRWLFVGLMAMGVAWIHLMNYVRLGRTLDSYPLRVMVTNWGGAFLIGLLLDGLAGFYLRPFFSSLQRLGANLSVQPDQARAAAIRAIRFPERAASLLLGVSAAMILVHRAVLYQGRLVTMLLSPALRTGLLSSMARDMVLALLLALLLFTFSRRVLRPGVEAFGLRAVPDEGRFPVGLRQALVVLVMGLFNITLFMSMPENIPAQRLIWVYLPPVLLTGIVAYLVAADIGHALHAIAGRLRMLAAGMRPAIFLRFAVTELDEVGELVAAINTMQDRAEREVRELERDMEAARSIQTGMLPRSLGLPPGWQLTASLHPAREVGGDFYDLIDLGAGRFGLAVGDAVGKGLPAALLMASTVSLIRCHAPAHESPGAVLAAVNRMLCASVPPMTFVTALYMVVDTARQELRVASAGHFPPMTGSRELELPPALPLGIEPDLTYAEQVWRLAPGEPVLLYSDGLIEGAGPDSHAAISRWVDMLAGPRKTADELVDCLMKPFRPGVQEGSLHDDVTVLALIPPATLAFELPSRDGAELEAAERAARFAQECGPAHRSADVATAVGEACLNAIAHGNRFQADLPVRIRLSAGPDWLEATVADDGQAFALPERLPDLTEQILGEAPIRGWGIHLIRSVADAVAVEPLPSGKQVRMQFGGVSGV